MMQASGASSSWGIESVRVPLRLWDVPGIRVSCRRRWAVPLGPSQKPLRVQIRVRRAQRSRPSIGLCSTDRGTCFIHSTFAIPPLKLHYFPRGPRSLRGKQWRNSGATVEVYRRMTEGGTKDVRG